MSDHKGYHITDQFGTYFITMTLVGWIDLFSRKHCRDIMIDSFKYCVINKGLIIYAYVIMSSHIHMIVSASEESDGLSAIIRDLKKFTSKQLIKWTLESSQESRGDWLDVVFKYYGKFNKNNQTYQLWQQNNYPKLCVHRRFTKQKLIYIHENPVKAGIVENAEEYRYSSARNYTGIRDTELDVILIDF